MFFSLTQVSNQLSPKSKIVDLFFLYNFYSGQNSSYNAKIRVLGSGRSNQEMLGNFWAVTGQTGGELRSDRCTPPPLPVMPRIAVPMSRPPLKLPVEANFVFASPLSPSPRARAPQPYSCAQRRRRLPRRPFTATSPSFLAPQASQTPISHALHLQRPAPSPISPFLGQNHARNRQPPLTLTPAPPLTADGPFPPHLDPIQGSGELHRALLHLPDPFSLDFGRRNRWERVSPPLAAARSWPASL